MKLHLGCGSNTLTGYTNCDILPGPGVDVTCSAVSLPFSARSCDEVLAEHLIEHLTYYEFNRMMAECARVLSPGGRLVLECPDLLEVCRGFVGASEYQRYESNQGHWPFITQLYGHQRGRSEDEIRSQVHKSGYTFQRLEAVLVGLGFADVVRVPATRGKPGSPCLRIEAVL